MPRRITLESISIRDYFCDVFVCRVVREKNNCSQRRGSFGPSGSPRQFTIATRVVIGHDSQLHHHGYKRDETVVITTSYRSLSAPNAAA